MNGIYNATLILLKQAGYNRMAIAPTSFANTAMPQHGGAGNAAAKANSQGPVTPQTVAASQDKQDDIAAKDQEAKQQLASREADMQQNTEAQRLHMEYEKHQMEMARKQVELQQAMQVAAPPQQEMLANPSKQIAEATQAAAEAAKPVRSLVKMAFKIAESAHASRELSTLKSAFDSSDAARDTSLSGIQATAAKPLASAQNYASRMAQLRTAQNMPTTGKNLPMPQGAADARREYLSSLSKEVPQHSDEMQAAHVNALNAGVELSGNAVNYTGSNADRGARFFGASQDALTGETRFKPFPELSRADQVNMNVSLANDRAAAKKQYGEGSLGDWWTRAKGWGLQAGAQIPGLANRVFDNTIGEFPRAAGAFKGVWDATGKLMADNTRFAKQVFTDPLHAKPGEYFDGWTRNVKDVSSDLGSAAWHTAQAAMTFIPVAKAVQARLAAALAVEATGQTLRAGLESKPDAMVRNPSPELAWVAATQPEKLDEMLGSGMSLQQAHESGLLPSQKALSQAYPNLRPASAYETASKAEPQATGAPGGHIDTMLSNAANSMTSLMNSLKGFVTQQQPQGEQNPYLNGEGYRPYGNGW